MVDSNSLQKIVVFGTGGTIAGQSALRNDNIGYVAAQVSIQTLSGDIAGLAAHVLGYELVFEQVAQVDSKDMNEAVWCDLAHRTAHALARPDVQGVVITHGTDTIEETAYFLHSVISATKPVVLTCAMRPATSLNSDGPQNMLDALSVVMDPQANGVGAVVVCAGAVHAAALVQKIHPYRVDAFSSGEAGPLGWVEEGRVRWSGLSMPSARPLWDVSALPISGVWPQVEIVMNHAGATGAVVQALVQAGVQGLVTAGTGNGTLSQPLTDALLQAMVHGVQVLRSTRCPLGQVVAAPQMAPDSSHDKTIPVAQGLSPVKARVALQLSLMGLPPQV